MDLLTVKSQKQNNITKMGKAQYTVVPFLFYLLLYDTQKNSEHIYKKG